MQGIRGMIDYSSFHQSRHRLLTDSSPQPHIVTLQPADTAMHAVGAAAALAAAAGEATAAAVEASSSSASGVGPVKVRAVDSTAFYTIKREQVEVFSA